MKVTFAQEKNGRGSEIPSLAIAIAGNLYIAGLFLRALLNPLGNADFIFKIGLWFFVVEFFSIFLSRLNFRQEKKVVRIESIVQTILSLNFLGTLTMVLTFGFLILRSFYAPIIFIASSVAKGFGQQTGPGQSRTWAYTLLLLLSTLFVFMVLTPERLTQWFPFPQELMSHKTPGGSGEFVDRPQTLLVWGTLYYILAAILEALIFFDIFAKLSPRRRSLTLLAFVAKQPRYVKK